MDKEYIRKFEKVDAPAPGWYIPDPTLYGPYRITKSEPHSQYQWYCHRSRRDAGAIPGDIDKFFMGYDRQTNRNRITRDQQISDGDGEYYLGDPYCYAAAHTK